MLTLLATHTDYPDRQKFSMNCVISLLPNTARVDRTTSQKCGSHETKTTPSAVNSVGPPATAYHNNRQLSHLLMLQGNAEQHHLHTV